MFRDNTNLPDEKINILLDDGGLGDQICRMSAIRHMHDHNLHCTFYVWVPDYFVDLARHLAPDITIGSFTDAKTKYDATIPGRQTNVKNIHNLACHLVDHAFHVLACREVDIYHKNYLQLSTKGIYVHDFKLPEKYVVITTGFTANVREMIPSVVNELSDYILKKGYTPVFLGSKQVPTGAEHVIEGTFKEEIDYCKGISLIDKTTLLQTGRIISESAAIVGLDNGLLHLAGCTKVPIVMGFTTVKPEHRVPYRNSELGWNVYPVVPPETLKCRFCQSNWDFLYDHDFRECFYRDTMCKFLLTSDRYIEKLEQIL